MAKVEEGAGTFVMPCVPIGIFVTIALSVTYMAEYDWWFWYGHEPRSCPIADTSDGTN